MCEIYTKFSLIQMNDNAKGYLSWQVNISNRKLSLIYSIYVKLKVGEFMDSCVSRGQCYEVKRLHVCLYVP